MNRDEILKELESHRQRIIELEEMLADLYVGLPVQAGTEGAECGC